MVQRPFPIIVEYILNVGTNTSPQEALRLLANGGVEIKTVISCSQNYFRADIIQKHSPIIGEYMLNVGTTTSPQEAFRVLENESAEK